MNRDPIRLLCCFLCAITACSGDDDRRGLTVGVEPANRGTGGHSPAALPQGGAGAGGNGATAVGNDNALSVQVHDIDQMVIDIITLSCAGDCADVEAVPRGGNPPYTLAWEDGSTDPKRRVCLDESALLRVSATDTAISDDEFSYAAQTAAADVTATVLDDCADAGMPPASGDFCIENPSMEGTPGVAEITGFLLPGWSMCYLSPNVEPGGGGSTMPASDGATYLGHLDAIQDSLNESAGTAFCAPLEPGRAISFSVDIAVTAMNPGAVQMELWGGSSSCSREELLWTSPVVSEPETWHTFCGTITPSKSYAYLVTWPVLASPEATASYVNIDNFRPRSGCSAEE